MYMHWWVHGWVQQVIGECDISVISYMLAISIMALHVKKPQSLI